MKTSKPVEIAFIVDGKIPCESWSDATFFADALADKRNEPVAIRRVLPPTGHKMNYVRKPRQSNVERDQPIESADYIIVDGERVVYVARSSSEAHAFQSGYGGGVMCYVHGNCTEREGRRLESLKIEAKLSGFELVPITDQPNRKLPKRKKRPNNKPA